MDNDNKKLGGFMVQLLDGFVGGIIAVFAFFALIVFLFA